MELVYTLSAIAAMFAVIWFVVRRSGTQLVVTVVAAFLGAAVMVIAAHHDAIVEMLK